MFFLEVMTLAAALAAPHPQSCGHAGSSGHSGHAKGGQSQPEPSRPKVRATNTLCPVMGEPVKAGRDREVVLRAGYYLVCCDGCGPELAEHPEKYLDKNGRPRNAPKEPEGGKRPAPDAPQPPENSGHQH